LGRDAHGHFAREIQEERTMATAAHAIAWQQDFDKALTQARGKSVLLDFSAAPM
jgi:hypothetical protein